MGQRRIFHNVSFASCSCEFPIPVRFNSNGNAWWECSFKNVILSTSSHHLMCPLSIRRMRVKCKQKNIHTWARCTNPTRIRRTRTGMFCVNIIEPATSVCILTSIFLSFPCARTHYSCSYAQRHHFRRSSCAMFACVFVRLVVFQSVATISFGISTLPMTSSLRSLTTDVHWMRTHLSRAQTWHIFFWALWHVRLILRDSFTCVAKQFNLGNEFCFDRMKFGLFVFLRFIANF